MTEFTEYLIMRHGQSVADVEKRFEGRADSRLTDKDLRQVRLAAEQNSLRLRHAACRQPNQFRRV